MSQIKEYLPRDAYNAPELQSTNSSHEKKKEELVDIVEALDSCVKRRKELPTFPIARVHCLYDGIGKTFWFTNQYFNTYDFPEHRELGNFVPRYSDVAIKMQKSDVGTSFQYETQNNIKRMITHTVVLENRSDLQNQTIVIAGDDIHHQYQYRNIKDFLKALQQNQEDIKNIEAEICEKNKLIEELSAVPNTASKRGQIKKTIKSLQEKYRFLTLQQEDLKNITIYIRKQGEMRYAHLVDPIQTRIMSDNRFDGKTIVINGGPGTGKTTTMIHRLSYLTDKFAIEEDEKYQLNNYKLNSQQRKQLLDAIENDQDWMFFSPSKLLKEYLAEAMKKEGLSNTSQKVWNWKDYCRTILQENYHLLEMKGSNAPFKASNIKDTLFYQNSGIINVFTQYYLDELRTIKTQLPQLSSEGKNSAWYSIALNIKKRFEETEKFDLLHFIMLFNRLESTYGNDCKRFLLDRNNALNELANEICDLLNKHKEQKADIEDLFDLITDEQETIFEDENNAENEEENAEDLVENSKEKATSKSTDKHILTEIQKWLKSFCYCKVNDKKVLTSEQKLIAGILLPILDDTFEDKFKNIGDLMVFEHFAQYTKGVRSIMLNGIATRYKKFREFLIKTKFEGCNLKLLRDIMQRNKGKEIHHQEQSLLLGFINTLVKQIKGSRSANIRHNFIDAYEYVSRPIIGVDEVTDFSICDIYAMQSLLKREFNSFTLCGDMMQRMTSYGINSWDELKGVVDNPKIVEMKTSYRQSMKLIEVARQLYKDTLRETPNYKSFMKFTKVPSPLVYVDDNEYAKVEWISKRISEVYRAYGELLPSIAIFLNYKDYIPSFIENLKNTEFFIERDIEILDGTIENNSKENYICVYPIDQVKGMEFDVVFFHNIDNSSVDTEILKRYIYVGVSRAAFFLAITLNEENNEISKYFEKNKDWFKI